MYKLVLIALNKLSKCPSCKQRDARSGGCVPTALAYPIGRMRTDRPGLPYWSNAYQSPWSTLSAQRAQVFWHVDIYSDKLE